MSEYAAVEAFARSQEAFALIVGWLGGAEAAGLGHAGLEEARARELARLLQQDYLDLRAAQEQRQEQATGPDGVPRTRAEVGHARPLSAVFDPVTVSRIAYRAPRQAERAPSR
jgi:hypothetical protein